MSDFIAKLKIEAAKGEAQGLDFLFDEYFLVVGKEEFGLFDPWLRDLNPNDFKPTISVGLLRITWQFRNHLANWSDFRERVNQYLIANGYDEKRWLLGLRT